MYGTGHGHKVSMKLAGDVVVPGVMTKMHEFVMTEGIGTNDRDITWIPPVIRTLEKLGIEARWRGVGTAAVICPTGDVVELGKEHDLAHIERNDC